jgi:hypothetical protein
MTTPPDPPTPPAEGSEEARIAHLEAGQTSLSEKIDRILGIVGGGPGTPGATGDEPADKPSTIAAEIRAQLDKRDADDKAKARADDHDKTVAELKAKVKELTEKPPAEPVKRRHKLMWGEG